MKLTTAILATAVLGIIAFASPARADGIPDASHSIIYSSASWKTFDFVLFKSSGFAVGGGYSIATGQPAFVTSKVAIYALHNILAVYVGGTAVGGNGGSFTMGPALNIPEVLRLVKADKLFPPFKYVVGGIQGVYSVNRMYRKDDNGNTVGNGTHWDAIPWGGLCFRAPF